MIFKKLGTKYGGWSMLPVDELDSDSIVYSFGAGEDISYEFVLSGYSDCEIHIFDPTPRAVEHFTFCTEQAKEKKLLEFNPKFGGSDPEYNSYIKNSEANLNKLFFHEYGVYDEDSTFEFFYPQDKNHVSLSIDNLQNTSDSIPLRVKKVDTILKELGHKHIDVMKLNIEGAEIKTLLYMLKNTNIRPTYISVKLELARDKGEENNSLINELQVLLNKNYNLVFSDQMKFNYTFKIKSV